MIVEEQIFINASVETVWECLTNPLSIAQWDEVPEDVNMEENLQVGDVFKWQDGEHFTTTTVSLMEPHTHFVQDLYVSTWEYKPESGEITYDFRIESIDDGVLLSLKIGDFSKLHKGQAFLDASADFAIGALENIKNLAEAIENEP